MPVFCQIYDLGHWHLMCLVNHLSQWRGDGAFHVGMEIHGGEYGLGVGGNLMTNSWPRVFVSRRERMAPTKLLSLHENLLWLLGSPRVCQALDGCGSAVLARVGFMQRLSTSGGWRFDWSLSKACLKGFRWLVIGLPSHLQL